jgi:aqualysin 1
MSLLPRSRRLLAGAGGIVLSTLLALSLTASPAHAEGRVLGAGHPDAISGSYVVALQKADDLSVPERASQLAGRFGGEVGFVYEAAITGFSVSMSESAARRLAAHPAVEYVEQDVRVELVGTQNNPPSWGLDRIDQRNLPLDNSYTYPNTASNVNTYILDTGVRLSHNDFGGRAFTGYDAITPGGSANDCNGHGTHVAGTVAGTAYGVAKQASIYSVRVLDCNGSGTLAGVVAGVDWVTANHVKPAVANMSLGASGTHSSLNSAVANSISSGVSYAIAAGNSNADACNFSPAQVSTAITVGATTSTDARASYSNFGTCVNIFAPGSSITSAWHTSNTASNTISGTSMAAPHVAGAAALILSDNPSWSPSQVMNQMISDATTGVVSNPGSGSPNRLLFVGEGDGSEPDPDPDPDPPSNCTGYAETYTGSLSGSGDFDIQPNGSWYFSGAGTHRGCLEGPSSGSSDFDLYLQRWNGWWWSTVASSTSPTNFETIDYTGNSGYYRWVVYSYQGSGSYTFSMTRP